MTHRLLRHKMASFGHISDLCSIFPPVPICSLTIFVVDRLFSMLGDCLASLYLFYALWALDYMLSQLSTVFTFLPLFLSIFEYYLPHESHVRNHRQTC